MSTGKEAPIGSSSSVNVELVEVFPGRPVTVTSEGWTIFVSIRDRAYLNQLKAWKRLLKASHPDAGGTGAKFRKIHMQRLRWQNDEALWYAKIGLLPPDGYRQAEQSLKRNLRLKGGQK